jgi:squalene monooxygenase
MVRSSTFLSCYSPWFTLLPYEKSPPHYDILIVGAGIAGPALAYSLSCLRPPSLPPLKIAILERSLSEPNRIVGELLQPGGMIALKKLGLSDCTEHIGAIPVYGYGVTYKGKLVHIPYPGKAEGRSFHHGRFVMALREKAREGRGVEMIEASVTELVECPHTKRVLGVRAIQKSVSPDPSIFFADLVICADGSASKFRGVLGSPRKAVARSHFFGAILKNATLPIKSHGTVALVPGEGPVLMYQIDEEDTRMLVDVKEPLPKDIPVIGVLPSLIRAGN